MFFCYKPEAKGIITAISLKSEMLPLKQLKENAY